jgi:SAM-dependent methyltransferase
LNDISQEETAKAAGKLGHIPDHVLITNYDALEYPEEARFDVSICKCVVHHLRRDTDLLRLLMKLRRITRRRAVIVDIEDIARNLKARLWNMYYRLLLEDDGGFFMSRERFFTIVANAYGGRGHIQFESLETFRGVYMIAVIDFDEGDRLPHE